MDLVLKGELKWVYIDISLLSLLQVINYYKLSSVVYIRPGMSILEYHVNLEVFVFVWKRFSVTFHVLV